MTTKESTAMSTSAEVAYGHPWDNRPEWERLHVQAETQAEMDEFIAARIRDGWAPWIVGECGDTGKPAAVMYRRTAAIRPPPAFGLAGEFYDFLEESRNDE
jgi:hypothetical protein